MENRKEDRRREPPPHLPFPGPLYSSPLVRFSRFQWPFFLFRSQLPSQDRDPVESQLPFSFFLSPPPPNAFFLFGLLFFFFSPPPLLSRSRNNRWTILGTGPLSLFSSSCWILFLFFLCRLTPSRHLRRAYTSPSPLRSSFPLSGREEGKEMALLFNFLGSPLFPFPSLFFFSTRGIVESYTFPPSETFSTFFLPSPFLFLFGNEEAYSDLQPFSLPFPAPGLIFFSFSFNRRRRRGPSLFCFFLFDSSPLSSPFSFPFPLCFSGGEGE